MKKITKNSTLEEIAFIVCSEFSSIGKTIVLTGGSAATVYAPEAYQSRDLDFMIRFANTGSRSIELLTSMGYKVGPSATYFHNESPITLDFIAGEIMVGETHIGSWNTLQKGAQLLHILHPEDSVCDRLASYLYWNDISALSAAAGIIRNNIVDLKKIKNWLETEGAPVDQTMKRLESLTQNPRKST
ncbi:hypothetical protein CCB80_13060 [Armatimonadetes bacterium Uphvl-Ar1]|nr:hypothetical protein CCB80_13060 [Armatimonadetes bacterium Uphvl-Ar1]